MKLAVVGWDINERVFDEFARLGLDCVVFTRWFPDRLLREERKGWTLIRCPHEIGGGIEAEAWSFAESVQRGAGTQGLAGERDVVHALDHHARPALARFKQAWTRCLAVGTVTEFDAVGEPVVGGSEAVDRWICSEPWVVSRWCSRYPGETRRIHIVESAPLATPSRTTTPSSSETRDPLIVIWMTAQSRLDPAGIVGALTSARRTASGLRAVVLGPGLLSETLRRRLGRAGLLSIPEASVADPSLDRWKAWLERASVVGLDTDSPPADAVARAAWHLGKPVLPLGEHDPDRLACSLLDLLFGRDRRSALVQACASFAERKRSVREVALAWLGVYLEGTVTGSGTSQNPVTDVTSPFEIGRDRSRLTLIPVDTRNVYASWTVWPADWATAMEWLGPDAAESTLTLRIADVTGCEFRGENSGPFQDFELGFGETHRTILLESPGRSLAAQLGVRSQRGYFHSLAHSRLCQLPSEAMAPERPTRRIRVLPRRDLD